MSSDTKCIRLELKTWHRDMMGCDKEGEGGWKEEKKKRNGEKKSRSWGEKLAANGDALEDVKDRILGCLAKEAHKADQFQGLIMGPG